MVTEGTGPVLRASDADRDNALDILRRNSVEGRLSYETFLHRMDLALQARVVDELAELVSDLPGRTRRRGAVRVVRWWSKSTAEVRRAWQTSRLSSRHAELRRVAGNWLLADLDSTNGTHINGWRAGEGFTVRPGDWVRFGRVRFRVSD